MIAGYGGGDVLQGVDLAVRRRVRHLHRRPERRGQVDRPARRSAACSRRARRGAPRRGARIAAGARPQILARGDLPGPAVARALPESDGARERPHGRYVIRRDRALSGKRYAEIEALFPLVADRADEKAGNLSGGQRRMVEFARSLMLDPVLSCSTSPRSGSIRKRPADGLRLGRSHDEGGKTLLLVEQNVRFGLGISTQGVVMESGRVILVDRAASLLANPEMGDLFFGGSAAAAARRAAADPEKRTETRATDP